MVAIDAEPLPIVAASSSRGSTLCPRWLQGIATINRMRRHDSAASGTTTMQPDQAAVSAALDRLCAHGQGKVAERIAAARLLPSICRPGDPEALAVLLQECDSISSSCFGM